MKKSAKKKPDWMKQIARHIERQFGWKVLMVGPFRIQTQPGARKFCHEFVVEFVGAKKEPVKRARKATK